MAFVRDSISFTWSVDKIGELNALRIQASVLDNAVQTIIGLYRPHTANPKIFTENLRIYLQSLADEEIVVVGDCNIDILGPDTVADPYTNNYSELFIPAINAYTRSHNNSRTCIDHAFIRTKAPLENTRSAIFETTITDHFAIIVQLPGPEILVNTDRHYEKRKIDYELLQNTISQELWTDIYMLQRT